MKNKFVFATIFIILAFLAVLAIAWHNSRIAAGLQREQMVADLSLLLAKYKNNEVDIIDISTITPFTWEKLYLFGPYSTQERIATITGVGFAGHLDTTISSNDGIVLLVFVNKNSIVQYMEYPRSTDFLYVVRDMGYSPEEAVFVLDEDGWIASAFP
jgi:hypothetical protein